MRLPSAAYQILVLHNGKIAETGDHGALLEKCGRDAALWPGQMAGEDAACGRDFGGSFL